MSGEDTVEIHNEEKSEGEQNPQNQKITQKNQSDAGAATNGETPIPDHPGDATVSVAATLIGKNFF